MLVQEAPDNICTKAVPVYEICCADAVNGLKNTELGDAC